MRVGEPRVREAIAERVERRLLQIAVGAPAASGSRRWAADRRRWRGKVIGRRPAGLRWRRRECRPSAAPPSAPGYQAWTIAPTCVVRPGRDRAGCRRDRQHGRLAEPTIVSSSVCCRPVSPRSVLSPAASELPASPCSPSMSGARPRQSTTTSARGGDAHRLREVAGAAEAVGLGAEALAALRVPDLGRAARPRRGSPRSGVTKREGSPK